MRAWNVTESDLRAIADEIGVKLDGNERAFTLKPVPGRDEYRRLSHDGARRVNAVCWHGHRDFMLHLFERHSDARLKSMLADYRGRTDFLAKFEATGDRNIGSMVKPTRYRNACLCT